MVLSLSYLFCREHTTTSLGSVSLYVVIFCTYFPKMKVFISRVINVADYSQSEHFKKLGEGLTDRHISIITVANVVEVFLNHPE